MNKRKNKRKINIFDNGGLISWLNNTGSKLSGNSGSILGLNSGGLSLAGGIANTVAGVANGLMNPSGNSTGVGNVLSGVGSLASNIPGIGGLVGAGVNLLGGLVNAAFGSNINEEYVDLTKSNIVNQAGYTSKASTNDQLMSDWGSHTNLAYVDQDDVGSDGWFSNKAKNLTKDLNNQIKDANMKSLLSLANTANNVDTQNDLNLLANFKAGGGRIHIKKKNRGKFTEYCGGKVTSECIQRGLHSSNSTTRKRANFARNARKWKHANGGYLYDEGGNLYTSVPNIGQHGGNFSNGVTIIGNGGTHEENPMEGVPMGIAPDGTPNLVEQGEVKFNDYVFSNRLFATGGLLAAHNLPTTYADHSFADIAERLSRESSERPNDPISKRGLISSMTRLQQAQEQLRAEEQSNMYAKGGHLFATGGPEGYDPVLLADPIDIEGLYDAEMTSEEPSSRQGSGLSWLRYAPAVGAGLGVLSDIFGWTNKPDYGNSDLVGNVADNLTEVSAKPIGNYLTYRPLDRNYYINKLNAQAGATRRAIVNQSGGNRATAMTGLLAADYNALNSLGELARKSEEYNQAQRERVEAFNRGTNQFNSEMALKAAIANKDNDKIRLQAKATQAQLREQAESRASAGRSANLTNLFDSLGEIGREEFSRNMIQSNPALYYLIDSNGNITYKNGYDELSEAEKKSVREAANKDKKRKKSKRGYLTIRGGR